VDFWILKLISAALGLPRERQRRVHSGKLFRTQRRAYDIIKDLELMELVRTRVEYLGRYGRTRIIELDFQDIKELINTILEDQIFKELDINEIEQGSS